MKRTFLFAALLAAAASPAWAHAMLTHASPAAGAHVPAPAEVRLDYSETLEPAFSGVTVADAEDHVVTVAAAMVDGSTIRVKLKPLAHGIYKVQWHAVSVDTHRTQGAYTFTVQ